MKDQGSISPDSKSTRSVDAFINEVYLEVSQDTECKRTIINFIKEFKNRIIILMTMTKTIQNLKMEFNKKKHLR